jgi:uncharacterized protein involved in outer membrane biogenesis
MRPLVKFEVTAAVVAAILFTAAALYLALVFDANRYKPELAAAARQAPGRELAIDGDLALGCFRSRMCMSFQCRRNQLLRHRRRRPINRSGIESKPDT